MRSLFSTLAAEPSSAPPLFLPQAGASTYSLSYVLTNNVFSCYTVVVSCTEPTYSSSPYPFIVRFYSSSPPSPLFPFPVFPWCVSSCLFQSASVSLSFPLMPRQGPLPRSATTVRTPSPLNTRILSAAVPVLFPSHFITPLSPPPPHRSTPSCLLSFRVAPLQLSRS